MAPETTRTPVLARFVLRALLPATLRDGIDGDLQEAFRRRLRIGDSGIRARGWYWRQVLTLRYRHLRREARLLAEHETARSPRAGSRPGVPVDAAVGELRDAVRSFRARPGLSVLVVTTLALSIGVTTAVFSVVNGVLLRPLPYDEPDRLVNVYQTHGAWLTSESPQLRAFASRFPLSYPIFEGWRDRNTVFDGLGAYAGGQFTRVGDGEPEIVRGLWVTAGLLPALGVQPALGRLPLPQEDRMGSQPVVILSHGFWQRRFGGDPAAVGRAIVFDGRPYTVVGVMPETFYFPRAGTAVWVTFDDELRARGIDSQFMNGVARLKPDLRAEDVVAELESLQPQIHDAWGSPLPEGRGARVESRLDEVVGDARQTLMVLLASVGLVLAVACGNIANLLLVSGLRRTRELAIRSALGASTRRLVAGLFAETVVLVTVGAALGVGLAAALHGPLIDLLPAGTPRRGDIALDGTVLAFAVTVTVVTALVVGSLPALLARHTDASARLREGGRGSTGSRGALRVRGALVVAEVALAFVLLAGAGLLANSFWRLSRVELGFQHDHVASVQVVLPEDRYAELDAKRSFVSRLHEEMRAIPGVAGVAVTTEAPFGGSVSSGSAFVERPDAQVEEYNLELSSVSESYFELLDIPLRAGRSFTATDMAAAEDVAILSEGAAELLWPRQNPLGRRLGRGDDDRRWLTVVGVVADVHHTSAAQPPVPKLYTPLRLTWQESLDWIVAADGNPAGVLEQTRRAVWRVDPNLPISSQMLVSDAVDRSFAEPRFRTLLIGTLAAMSGLLAVLGVSGVVAFVVSQRVPEIGVRLALGASPRAIVARITAAGFRLAVLGIVIGLLITLPAARSLEEMLFGVSTRDAGTLFGVLALVALVSATASWWPARRAARVDPVSVLNAE